jgi:hypothetical protein
MQTRRPARHQSGRRDVTADRSGRSQFERVPPAMNTVAAIEPRHAAGQRLRERIFRGATLAAALVVLALLGGVAITLIKGAWPAFSHFKFGFLTTEIWNPVTDKYGALAPIYGTLVTSLIAMLLAVPISLRHRHFSHRARALVDEAAHRRRDRAAGRGAEHHLRHLGLVRARAGVAAARAALPDRMARPIARASANCSRGRPSVSASSPRARARHHGHPVHLGGHARCLRDRPAC